MSATILIITGSESSGNRLAQRIFCEMTGWPGDSQMTERWWRKGAPPDAKRARSDVVTLRTLPHGGIGPGRQLPNVLGFATGAREAGFRVEIIITTRDRNIVAMSKAREHLRGDVIRAHAEVEAARQQLRQLRMHFRCAILSYETLMFFGVDYASEIALRLNLPDGGCDERLSDGNRKYLRRRYENPV